MNWELPHAQAGLRKGRGTRDQIAVVTQIIHWNTEKQESSRKTSTSASLTMLKPLTVWITASCGKFLKILEYQTTLRTSWETCMQVKKQQLEPDMEQRTGSKSEKEYVKAVYCHLANLTYMQSTSCEMPGGMNHKLESKLPGKISITSDMQMTPHIWQQARETEEPLDEGEGGEWTNWLKTQHSKN